MPVVCIFSYTIKTCLKRLDGTKSLNTKQWCPAELSPRIIHQVSPFLPKMFPLLMSPYLLYPPRVDCPPFPWIFMGNPGDWGEFQPTVKYFLISPGRKIPFNRLLTSSATKSVVPSKPNSNFLVINLCNLHL